MSKLKDRNIEEAKEGKKRPRKKLKPAVHHSRPHSFCSCTNLQLTFFCAEKKVLPHLQGNIEIGRHKDRNAEVGNTKHRIY